MAKNSIPKFLDTLIDVFLDNLLFYIPSEIIFEGILEQIEHIPPHLFDQLSLLDRNHGIYRMANEDVVELNQRLFKKRSLLEENIFALIEKNKEITSFEFKIILEKYYDQLLFYIFITDWLLKNINKYNEDDIHLGVLGAFKLQHEYLSLHLKNLYHYFGDLIDIKKEHDFSTEKMVLEHFPDLIYRVSQSKFNNTVTDEPKIKTEIAAEELTQKNHQTKKRPSIKKKERLKLSDPLIEKIVLEGVFKIKTESTAHLQ